MLVNLKLLHELCVSNIEFNVDSKEQLCPFCLSINLMFCIYYIFDSLGQF